MSSIVLLRSRRPARRHAASSPSCSPAALLVGSCACGNPPAAGQAAPSRPPARGSFSKAEGDNSALPARELDAGKPAEHASLLAGTTPASLRPAPRRRHCGRRHRAVAGVDPPPRRDGEGLRAHHAALRRHVAVEPPGAGAAAGLRGARFLSLRRARSVRHPEPLPRRLELHPGRPRSARPAADARGHQPSPRSKATSRGCASPSSRWPNRAISCAPRSTRSSRAAISTACCRSS